MTHGSSTREAKQTLRALATAGTEDSPRTVVDEAATTLASVEAAAQFLTAGGEERLARAVVQAVRDDDEETIRRGRRVLTTLESLSTALDGDVRADGAGVTERDTDEHGRRASVMRGESLSPRSRNGFRRPW